MPRRRGPSSSRRRGACAVALAVAWCVGVAFGQADAPAEHPAEAPTAEPGLPAAAAGGWSVRAVRTDTPPTIDGDLSDPAWEDAAVITDFTQVDPVEGDPPSEDTELRILFDKDYLYIAVRCHDADPSGIRATQMRRDGGFAFDDSVAIAIDPYDSRRNGFYFQVNPVGAQRDALIENNDDLTFDWDGIWLAKARIDDEGWTAEIAIPFKTISFNPNADRWGLNADRVIRRRLETVRWATPVRQRGLASVSDAGDLTGLEDLDQGIGLDIKPFVVMQYEHDDPAGEDSYDLDFGFDLFYKITPQLNLALTYNTDFAETEVDDRRVNLTRFPLFFPEKRDFFLQDTDVFEFGGIGRNPLPFFSRRIGIAPDGQPLDIIYGARLTGRVGPFNVGLLNVQVDEGAGIDSKNLTVARATYNVGRESNVGFIATVGDPQTNDDNYLVGADFKYRNSTDFGDDVLEINGFAIQSDSTGADGDQSAIGGSVRYFSDNVQVTSYFTHIGGDHNPAIGFAPRTGIREYGVNVRKRIRPKQFRRVDLRLGTGVVTNTDNQLETLDLTLADIEFETHQGEVADLRVTRTTERLFDPFNIFEDVVISTGRYTFHRVGMGLRTATSRQVRGTVDVEFGEFFDGTRLDFVTTLEWRPSPYFSASMEYEQNDVDLDDGSFITRIARVRTEAAISPELTWSLNVQWDNASDLLGINSRVRWIYTPGSEVFFVVNHGVSTLDDRFEAQTTEVTVKVGLTFRF